MGGILNGDVFAMLPTIKAGSIDCCVTSPPYWMLRSYLPKGHPLKKLEIGQEPTPEEFIAKLVAVFQLVRVCLADHGTCWINIGDTYAHAVEESNMALIPQRLAIALQDDGWIVRSYVIWHKPAPMPCSVTGWAWRRCKVKVSSDRGSRSVKVKENGNHRAVSSFKDERSDAGRALSAEGNPEWSDCPGCKKCNPNGGYVLRKGSWRPTSSYEPVLMLAKTGDYFADGEPVKTAAAEATIRRDKYTRVLDDADEQFAVKHDHETLCLSGANLRDVWKISAEPLGSVKISATEKIDHYAAYPTELVRKCLLASVSQKGYCPSCGKPWVRVIDAPFRGEGNPVAYKDRPQQGSKMALCGDDWRQRQADEPTKTIGWRASCSCSCELPPRPGRVLDPFAGSGRTGIAAGWLGLDFVGVELNPKSVQMAEHVMREDSPLFALTKQA